MTPADQTPAGQRIARARRRRGLSQAVLAGLVGRSESWLSQVERGQRGVDSHAVLTRLAAVLRVDLTEITGDSVQADRSPLGLVARIEQAMMRYDALESAITRTTGSEGTALEHLRATVHAAYRDYQATRYEQAGRRLPGLIRRVEAAARSRVVSAEMSQVRALVYDTTAALLSRVGEQPLAWAAADRAMAAAESSEVPLLVALAAWRLSYVLTSRGHPREGLGVAVTAAGALEQVMGPASPAQLSMYGALHLAAATAAAADYDQHTAPLFLRQASRAAERLGRDANLMGTAFGPVNVAIHAMAVSARLGDAAAVVAAGEALDASALPPELVGRRAQVYLDLAGGYAMRKQDAAAVNVLLAAEGLSPQLIRFDQRTHEVITGLLRREHRPSTPQLRPLARRTGVI